MSTSGSFVQRLENKLNKIVANKVRQKANNVLRDTKKDTPKAHVVKGYFTIKSGRNQGRKVWYRGKPGTLRAGWKLALSPDGQGDIKDWKPGMSIYLVNPTYYAKFVEYGTKFQPAVHMATKAIRKHFGG